jgi:hypothetical protein
MPWSRFNELLTRYPLPPAATACSSSCVAKPSLAKPLGRIVHERFSPRGRRGNPPVYSPHLVGDWRELALQGEQIRGVAGVERAVEFSGVAGLTAGLVGDARKPTAVLQAD